jgi:hypothetical protein
MAEELYEAVFTSLRTEVCKSRATASTTKTQPCAVVLETQHPTAGDIGFFSSEEFYYVGDHPATSDEIRHIQLDTRTPALLLLRCRSLRVLSNTHADTGARSQPCHVRLV